MGLFGVILCLGDDIVGGLTVDYRRFRPDASLIEWVAAAGSMLLVTLAFIWLAVDLGLFAKTVEGESNLPMPLVLLLS